MAKIQNANEMANNTRQLRRYVSGRSVPLLSDVFISKSPRITPARIQLAARARIRDEHVVSRDQRVAAKRDV